MTAVKMSLINVGPQVSADICRGDGSGLMWMARGSRGGRGSKWHFLRTFFINERSRTLKPQKC